jgi:hypothetical protein
LFRDLNSKVWNASGVVLFGEVIDKLTEDGRTAQSDEWTGSGISRAQTETVKDDVQFAEKAPTTIEAGSDVWHKQTRTGSELVTFLKLRRRSQKTTVAVDRNDEDDDECESKGGKEHLEAEDESD